MSDHLPLFEKPKRPPKPPKKQAEPRQTEAGSSENKQVESSNTRAKSPRQTTKTAEPSVPRISPSKNKRAATDTPSRTEAGFGWLGALIGISQRGGGVITIIRRYGLYLAIGIVALLIILRVTNIPKQSALTAIFTAEVLHWQTQILSWSAQYGIDPNLIATIMQIESCGSPGAASGAGAQGLFQVMPSNFASSVSANDMLDPATNAQAGLGVLRDCLRWANNDVGQALACYNGGPSLIGEPTSSWPGESQRYVVWGTGIYTDASRHTAHSTALDNWLTAGGSGLCNEAATALGLSTSVPAPALSSGVGAGVAETTFSAPLSALPTFSGSQAIIPPTATPPIIFYMTP